MSEQLALIARSADVTSRVLSESPRLRSIKQGKLGLLPKAPDLPESAALMCQDGITTVGEYRPLVSIGMPAYNGETYIRQALDSLLTQEYTNIELIICDDASTDATEEICRQYAAQHKQIRYYRNRANIGIVRNYERVLDLSKGEYFMWAQNDDTWDPTFVGTLVQLLSLNPDVVLAFSAYDNVDERDARTKTYPHIFSLPSSDLFKRLQKYILQGEHLGKPNLFLGLMRRSAIQQVDGLKNYNDDLWGFDTLVVLQLLALGDAVLIPQLLFHKRAHKRAVSFAGEGVNPYASVTWSERLAMCKESLRDRHRYFAAQNSIISRVDKLSNGQRFQLKAMLYARAGFVYMRYIIAPCLLPFAYNPLRKRSIRLPAR